MGIEVNGINCCGCGAPLTLPKSGARKIKCPYCEVENITSTAGCGINTGIYPQLDSIKIEIKAIKSTANSLYGENDPSAKFNFTGSGTSAFFR